MCVCVSVCVCVCVWLMQFYLVYLFPFTWNIQKTYSCNAKFNF